MLSFFRPCVWRTANAFLPFFALIFLVPTLGRPEESPSQPLSEKAPGVSIPNLSISDSSSLTGKEFQKEIRDAMKRWKTVASSDASIAATELLALYQALKNDATLAPSAKENLLRSLRRKLDLLSLQILKAQTTSPQKKPESVKGLKNCELGQAMNVAAPGAFSDESSPKNQTIQDAGENLVEVIQQTIHPDSWDANGGNGQIQFWLPNGTLVIRQTEPIHQEIQGLLNQLRRAGG